MCLVRDGAAFPCGSMDSLLSIRNDCARIGRARGIWVAVKQRGKLAHIADKSGLYYEVQELLIKGWPAPEQIFLY